jgi:hypothetical protein
MRALFAKSMYDSPPFNCRMPAKGAVPPAKVMDSISLKLTSDWESDPVRRKLEVPETKRNDSSFPVADFVKLDFKIL